MSQAKTGVQLNKGETMEQVKQFWTLIQKHPKISIAVVVIAAVVYHLVT
jgi:hypothetical protein